MHSINVITSSSLKRRQKSPAVVGSGIRSAPSAFMYAVSWRKRYVLQPCAATQNVVRKVQHVIRLMAADAPSAARGGHHVLNQTQLGDQPMHRGDAPEAHRVRVRPNLIVHRARVEHRLAPSVPVPCLAVSSSYLALAPGTVHAALIRRYSLHRKGLLRWIRGSHQEPTNSNKGKPFRFSFLGQSRQSRLLRG